MSQFKPEKLKLLGYFKLVFANNTILSCFFLFLLIINLYFLMHLVLLIPIGIVTDETKVEMKHIQWQQKRKQVNVQYNLKHYKPFCASD